MLTLSNLYKAATGCTPERIDPITGSGSNRRYYRLSAPGAPTLIGVEGDELRENEAFITMARHFRSKGIEVPEVVAVSEDRRCYLLSDLGSRSLFDAIASGRATGEFSAEEVELLRRTIRRLPDIQWLGADGYDFAVTYPVSAFDSRSVMWDLSYFKYDFLKLTGLPFDEALLQDDFDRLAAHLLDGMVGCHTFMYRDFQSRNVMLTGDDGMTPAFIDFQGGRRGPVEYDLVSFLWQAKANIPASLRVTLIDEYLDAASRYADIDRERFLCRVRYFVIFRLLQVLGAYGFRGLFERKAHFLESIPPAVRLLRDALTDDMRTQFPAIAEIADALYEKYGVERPARTSLLVTVMSFSYKKGLPVDDSGNGGGFIFDCRGMHNPGRYAEYKQLTGHDLPVIEFLEQRGEIQPYLSHCYALVDASVEVYMRRGFTSLMVAFGCTGGQHRSVYCAEHMAAHLREKYNVDVMLIHREHPASNR